MLAQENQSKTEHLEQHLVGLHESLCKLKKEQDQDEQEIEYLSLTTNIEGQEKYIHDIKMDQSKEEKFKNHEKLHPLQLQSSYYSSCDEPSESATLCSDRGSLANVDEPLSASVEKLDELSEDIPLIPFI